MKFATIMLFAFICTVLVILFGCAPTVDQPDPPVEPVIECDDNGCCPKVAGRYHLRKRTNRFFRRVC